MNKLFYTTAYMIIAFNISCKNTKTDEEVISKNDISEIKFRNDTINIGYFKSGGKKDIIFYALNISDIPLIIDTLQASCSCTIGSFTRKPI